eukprot:TRINITY_DN11846_c0_g1_i1.p1 TRINITY_DN11846_c0_g1~~TRINITY_DN11846_c0_g1_i1.p1  ORF type:complete len:1073 (+),score=234.63 TRINITY_DN11846_c0_g1_i1:25-3243(+)
MAEAITVGVRLRPLVPHEHGQKPCFAIKETDVSIIQGVVENVKDGPWRFDYAMDSSAEAIDKVDNKRCYELMGRRMVDQVLDGFNTCLFCYGQTGTGKTTTIMGDPMNGKGLLPMLLGDICEEADAMRARGCDVSLDAQMMEVYNEKINDLLVAKKGVGKPIHTHAMPTGVVIKGAEIRSVKTVEECIDVIEHGNSMKTVAATMMNPQSSRGHTVFKLSVHKSGGEDMTTLNAEVYFADLAGHENEKTTKVQGERLTELAFINKSLMWLQNAIHGLCKDAHSPRRPKEAEGDHKGDKDHHEQPVQKVAKKKIDLGKFRNSQLTMLLANAMTGNSRTAVIVTLSPATAHFDTTLGSLKFAAEAKSIKMEVVTTVKQDPQSVIKHLQDEVKQLKVQLAVSQGVQDPSLGPSPNPEQPWLSGAISPRERELSAEKEKLAAELEAAKAHIASLRKNGGGALPANGRLRLGVDMTTAVDDIPATTEEVTATPKAFVAMAQDSLKKMHELTKSHHTVLNDFVQRMEMRHNRMTAKMTKLSPPSAHHYQDDHDECFNSNGRKVRLRSGSRGRRRDTEDSEEVFTNVQTPYERRSSSFHPLERQVLRRSPKVPRDRPVRCAINWSTADPERWRFDVTLYNGQYSYHHGSLPEFEKINGPISAGVDLVKSSPMEFEGVIYQTSMVEWPEEQQVYRLQRRTGAKLCLEAEEDGSFTWIHAAYVPLKADVEIKRDIFTDNMTFRGNICSNLLCPGRGHGLVDAPGVKLIGLADPKDVFQGELGDCWLLSAISAMAEYDGTITKLFSKTEGFERMPRDESNTYTVTLFDLPTWQPVQVSVDERLCGRHNQGLGLVGTRPSPSGELWVCYIEKAVAAHCGGWDLIDGGVCTHAWRLLTGCKHQYTFSDAGEGFRCLGTFNPNEVEWEALENSPHMGFRGLWEMPWPSIGGGGYRGMTVDGLSLFERMCAWHEQHFLMCCGTTDDLDESETDGLVDSHAYTILDCISNVAGTPYDLIKIRNPWGSGEFKSGRWDDDGPGWETHPEVKAFCKPVKEDDGIFWLEVDEFFKYFKTIYLCAMNMLEFAK